MNVPQAIEIAIREGEAAWGGTSPNPPVGCVIVSATGDIVGTGHTQSPQGSGDHAEVMALRMAGDQARGATAVVTLEPCNHAGRTGPCSHALLDAGIAEVIYLTEDPNPQAAGGAEYLRSHGVAAHFHPVRVAALQPWLRSLTLGRPHVTVKMAHTLDGFSAAEDGSSQWITSKEARAHAHMQRSRVDAIVVGTGTVLADNPRLSARDAQGELLPRQPQPVVIGSREIPQGFHLAGSAAWRFKTPAEALDALWHRGVRSVLVEGGPGLVGAFLINDLVDELHNYVSPSLLGAGMNAVSLPLDKATSMCDIRRFEISRIVQFEEDILIESRPLPKES